MNVEEYFADFDHLMLKGEFEESKEHFIARYFGGLKYEIRNVVTLQPYWSLHDVVKLALKVERQINAKGVVNTKYGAKGDSSKGVVSKAPNATSKTTPKS